MTQPIREKELRLALVCYGGISLAVYMHGITKEVWHLARASQARGAGIAPPAGTPDVYATLLAEIERAAGLRLRILPDILAGASAGGINAIFLAQAISAGHSLDPLTDLWLDGADVEALIDETAAPASRFSKVWALPLAWMAAGRSDAAVDAEEEATRAEVRAKLSHFIRSRWFEPPFSGRGFTTRLLDAFAAMADAARGPRLLPDAQPLDLFVTVTDFTGHPERITLNSPPEITETEHRLIFGFSDEGDADRPLGEVPELAFAARATSSFPGAFPPFTVAELDNVLAAREQTWPGRTAFLRRILPRLFAARAAESAVLIDGSVLANAPFGPAIEALRERPARREVDRRFVYVDPAPGNKLHLAPGGRSDGPPGFFQTIIGAVSELPRHQPIRDNLEAIARRSDRIAQMQRVLAAVRPDVEAEVERLFGRTLFLDRPTPARIVAWRRRAQEAAVAAGGYGYAAYDRFKLAGVADAVATLARAIAGESGAERARTMREAIDRALTGADGTALTRTSEATIARLRTFDLGYRIRRLRLLARRLGEIEQDADDPGLAAMREAIYESLATYVEKKRAHAHAPLGDLVRAMRGDADEVLDALGRSLDLPALDLATDARLAPALAALERPARRTMLLHYLGFPYLDAVTLPMFRGEDVDEYDPIKVDRISPDDARSIREGGAEATLKGVQFNTFGAFFSRAWRENDYLWGRLHGAERMIDIVTSTLPRDRRLPAGRITALKRRAFVAILDEEEPRLNRAAGLIATIRREIG